MSFQNNLLIFVVERYNGNSIAALAGALDQARPDLPLLFLPGKADLGERIRRLAGQYRQVAVAFSFMSPQRFQVQSRLESLHPRPDNVRLVAGGPHASGDPAGTLRLGFDVVVIGEGEAVFPSLLDRILSDQSYTDLPGLAWLDEEGALIRTRPGPWVDLDAYPPFSLRHNRLAAIEITRGCPWACSFCQTSFFLGGRMRYRSVEHILDWLKRGRAEVDMRFARFISSDCFCYGSPDGRQANLAAVERLLSSVSGLMGKENTFFGSFPSEVRPGPAVTEEGLALIKKYAANDNIVIGAQSGSPRLLKAIHRGHTIEDVFLTAERVVRAGLDCYVDFIFGLPGETAQDRALTLAAIRHLTQMGAKINSHFFYPLPGTPLARAIPGSPDKETLRLLERLTRQKQEIGRWKGRLKTLAAMQAPVG